MSVFSLYTAMNEKAKNETTNDKIAAIALRKIEQQISFFAVGNHAFLKRKVKYGSKITLLSIKAYNGN